MGGTATDDTRDAPSAAVAFAPDTRIAGRYRVVRFVAAGGMGEVYAADDLVLGGPVALKTLRGELAGSARAIERLRREVALARKITHPAVCRLHDVVEHDGRVVLTMELLAGETLAARIARGPLALPEVERIAGQLVAGLAAAHAAGVVHRDLKPGNVILDGERAVITDFGLARSETADLAVELTANAGLLGTPGYMAPEQVEGREATAASDIYALGVVLFEMVTGEPPFRADTAMATATARLHQDPPRPRAKRRDLPAGWEAAILRCLARAPSARFARVEDVLAATRAKPHARRWRAAAIAIALGAVAPLAIVLARGGPGSPAIAEGAGTQRWPGLRPASAKAAVHFDHARAALAAGHTPEARELLEQAAAVDHDDPIPKLALAEVLDELGHEERAREAIGFALARGADLPEPVRQLALAIDAGIRDAPADAVAPLRRLVELEPDERGHRVRLAGALAAAGRAVDARAELARLGSPRAAERITVELIEAAVARHAGDAAAMLRHATAAATHARATRRPHDEAGALIVAGAAHWLLGDTGAAARAAEQALALGHSGAAVRARAALIDLDLAADRIGSAARRHREQAALVRTLGNRRLLVGLLIDGAWYTGDVGDPATAAADLVEARRVAIELASDADLAWIDLADGMLAQDRGELARASRLMEAAYRGGERVGAPSIAISAFHNWLPVLEELDDPAELARARAMHRSDVEREAESFLALRDGDLDRAERIARGHADRLTYDGREALVVIAHVAVKRGRLAEAATQLAEVTPLLVGDGTSIVARDRLIRARAELLARQGDLAGALAVLDDQAAACANGALVFCELVNAGFAVVLAARADRDGAARRAEAVLPRARALGFRRTVRDVEAALAGTGQPRNAPASTP